MKNDFTKLKEQIIRETQEIEKNSKTREVIENKIYMLKSEVNNSTVDMEKKKEVFERAMKKLNRVVELTKSKKPELDIDNDSGLAYEIKIIKEQTRHNYLKNAIFALSNENPELKQSLGNALQEFGIVMPSRSQSERMDSVSQVSLSSKHSKVSEKFIK